MLSSVGKPQSWGKLLGVVAMPTRLHQAHSIKYFVAPICGQTHNTCHVKINIIHPRILQINVYLKCTYKVCTCTFSQLLTSSTRTYLNPLCAGGEGGGGGQVVVSVCWPYM